ncbi:PREDICTED: phosphatidylinositol 4-kinase beta 1-like isoform X1 [Camelina sativa]|uniref:1-phosphatidylinositol 4-kinase n=1 Tax=Camelina sativa TaxID=90675 RepID=A0ABM0UPY1_CAMSA|nr:PREDICTED: phosphatidylinositol 4-kinase beta 1-like isoform X1 [Camelina sativa]
MPMGRFLSLVRGDSAESPREITSHSNIIGDTGSNGWLIRFFDSAFFCEWIAVSYLYKHPHAGVRDYLCNRMYTLPLSGIESYLFQICYMMVHKPSPSLDKFVIDICAKSLKIALKVHWFLLAELEDSDDNEGISRIQEKCQIAATLMGEWSPLMRPQNDVSTPGSKNQVLNRLLSSKQKLFSLTLSPPTQKSLSFSPSPGTNVLDDGSQLPSEDNKIFKKLIPSPKVRDALMFRKSVDKDDEESEKEGFFKRLMRDNKGEADEPIPNSEGFFKRLLKDNKSEDEDITNSSEGFFKRLLSSKGETEELTSSSDGLFKRLLRDNKGDEEELGVNSDSFFKRLLRESKNEDEESNPNSEGFFKKLFRDSKPEEDKVPKEVDDEDKDGFLKKLFREKNDDKRPGSEKNETNGTVDADKKSGEEDEREGFFKKFFKEKSDDKKDIIKADDGNESDGDESPEFSLFKRLFRIHPEDAKPAAENEHSSNGLVESSPGTENFFRKLFRDRDQSVEDSELFGSKKHKEKRPGSPKQRDDTPSGKPPLPNNTASQFRKGAYHESLEFVQALCETSYGLVDIFPIEDRKIALRESLAEINFHLSEAETTGGICFPMGRGVYRVVHIPEDECILLNSREKAPYMISVEVLKAETPSAKDTSNSQKLSKGGIPLANGDAFLQKPPPWAYPLWTTQEVYRNSADRMSLSTAQAIDQAMTPKSEVKAKLVSVSLSVENRTSALDSLSDSLDDVMAEAQRTGLNTDLEWVRVVVTADPGLRMEGIPDPSAPRKKEHRRVPSTVAMEEVRAAAAKGEAPPGLPLKGAGQEDSSDAQPRANGGMLKEGDALSGELWEGKRDRICKASIYGKLPGWDLRSIIVKSGDDCRQEHLAVQLISHFYDIFQEAGLPLWLRPYEVLVTSSYTALIETIPDTASIHSIKSRYPNITSLRDFFVAKYKENSPSFKLAQRNFVESMAGYSLVCYLLQVKDRHNGNLLLDEEGHIIHIDFGFMLSNSPGGVNFESAPFKLTRELLEVMDSDADGVPSEFFDYFKVLCIQGFLTCRKHAERIILLVEMLQDSGFPCFKGGPRTIQNLRKRFHLSLTEEQCVSLVLSLISSSLDAWRTRQYDYYQRVLNGIL